MKERLERLKDTLGVQWKDIANALGISVPMLGCLRRGERNPSAKLLRKVEELEKSGVVLPDTTTDWMSRAIDAESKLEQVSDALELILKATEKLRGAVK